MLDEKSGMLRTARRVRARTCKTSTRLVAACSQVTKTGQASSSRSLNDETRLCGQKQIRTLDSAKKIMFFIAKKTLFFIAKKKHCFFLSKFNMAVTTLFVKKLTNFVVAMFE